MEGEEFVFPLEEEGARGRPSVAKEESRGRSVGGTKRGRNWNRRGRELYPGARHKSLWTDSMFD